MGNIKELTIHLKQLFIEAFGKNGKLKLKFKLAIFITKGNQLTGVLKKSIFLFIRYVRGKGNIFYQRYLYNRKNNYCA